IAGACGTSNDVWYRFVANSTNPTISISSAPANSRFQIFSGTCAVPTSVYCSTVPSIQIPVSLNVGANYLIRVFSSTNATGTFNICITDPPVPRYGNSYVNISKKTNGGVVENGDTLEIRMTIHITSGTIYNARYLDNVPINTQMLTGIADSIRVITNEGLTYKRYTRAGGDDAATYIAAPPAGDYQIRLNLGFGTPVTAATTPGIPTNNSITNITGAAQMINTARPRGGSGLLFATAFRVVVTGNPGDIITLGAGRLIYRSSSTATIDMPALTATQYQILISEPADLCADNIGVNIAGEFGGTFGNGNTLNRASGPTFPIPGYNYLNNVSATQAVGDGNYAIVNNISPRSSTNKLAKRVPNCAGPPAPTVFDNCNNRMFNGHWDVDGDHSGTATPTGNLPPAAGTNSGYMLMVNADYVASEVYRQTINGLCPNTDYEFSAWVRNICPTCGIDSTGVAQYRPGVLPNLTFVLDGIDRYSSGNMDTVGWLNKGFLFRTGAAQTSMTFSIRNNGQGGGGNDWVMDDITITTCLPTMSYSPSLTPNICEGNALTIYDTVRSYFDNYVNYIWQRSTDGGTNWVNISAPATASPTPTGGGYQFVTSYTIPPGSTTLADSADLYRVIVATTVPNLSTPSCQVTDQTNIITLSVLDCTPVLKTELLSFNGKLVNDISHLTWSTSKEESPLQFIIERSQNGRDFTRVALLDNYNNEDAINHYSFNDPVSVNDKAWYRIAIVTPAGKKNYSSIIQLKKDISRFDFGNIINPFSNSLVFDIMVSGNATLTINLVDMAGRIVVTARQLVYTGVNNLNLANIQTLQAGVYTLQVINKESVIRKQVIKR
ncbi:MAG: T9SS type A sorting domain-containing protein, partial [Chitinophagaceae bacterium]